MFRDFASYLFLVKVMLNKILLKPVELKFWILLKTYKVAPFIITCIIATTDCLCST